MFVRWLIRFFCEIGVINVIEIFFYFSELPVVEDFQHVLDGWTSVYAATLVEVAFLELSLDHWVLFVAL